MSQFPTDRIEVAAEHLGDVRSTGGLHGSALGQRNVSGRLAALERLSELRGRRLLDVGCATGEYTRRLAENFEEVLAIDVERNRLEVFRRNCPRNVTIRLDSVYAISRAEDGVFDRIVLIEVLEHLPNAGAALSALVPMIDTDGRILITTPNRWWPFEQHGVVLFGKRRPGHVLPGLTWLRPLHRRLSDSATFSARELHDLAERAGLVVDGITYMMPPLDSRPEHHWLRRLAVRLERTRLGSMGQTIVASLRVAEG